MSNITPDDAAATAPATARVIIRPPLAWALAVIAGFALDWLEPLPFLPDDLPAGLLGALVFVLALALALADRDQDPAGRRQGGDHRPARHL